jgi:hypothetical protein
MIKTIFAWIGASIVFLIGFYFGWAIAKADIEMSKISSIHEDS